MFFLLNSAQTDFINRPTIESETHGHAIKGDKLRLKCSVDVRPSVQFSINWTLPNANAAMMVMSIFVCYIVPFFNSNTTLQYIFRKDEHLLRILQKQQITTPLN